MSISKIAEKKYIQINKAEYARLKQLQKYFAAFWNYFEHIRAISEARKDIKAKRVLSQEKLFKKLGI